MIDGAELAGTLAGAIGGLFAGLLFFGGLWWTICRLPDADKPLVLYFGSLFVRMGIALGVFIGLLLGFGWPGVIAGLIGFLVARKFLERRLGHAGVSARAASEAES